MDLSAWDFHENGAVELKGRWELYWGQLLDPTDPWPPFQDGWLDLPRDWSAHRVKGKRLGGNGQATFRLRVKLPKVEQPLAVYIPHQNSAYALWIGGQLIARNGELGESGSPIRPEARSQIERFTTAARDVDFVLQVANRQALHGGPTQPIYLGLSPDLEAARERLRYVDVVLFGSLLLIGLYHLQVFALFREERACLFLALTCLVFAPRILVSGVSGHVLDTILSVPWPWMSRLSRALLRLGVGFLLLHAGAVLPKSPLAPLARWCWYGSVFFCGVSLAAPYAWVERSSTVWQLCVVPLTVAALVFTGSAARAGNADARQVLLGWGALGITGLVETLVAIISPGESPLVLVPFGMLALVSVQSRLVARRLRAAFLAARQMQSLREARAEAVVQQHQAKLEALRYQVNPHFLLNALTSIRGAILSEPTVARDMVTELAEYCNVALHPGHEEMLLLDAELEQTQQFLNLAKTRRDRELRVAIEAPPELGRARVPARILQPLVENAVKYGAPGEDGVLEVRIAAQGVEQDRLQLTVSNTGAWVDENTNPHREGSGVGMSNIRERLWHHYGSAAHMNTRNEPGWVHVGIMLPHSSS